MKYHKISGVELKTCTAEQKIAYNLAFNAHISFGDAFNNLDSGIAKAEAVIKIRDRMMNQYRLGYNYKHGRYDEDAIQSALHAGLRNYLEKPFIANDYESIGKAFPAHYL